MPSNTCASFNDFLKSAVSFDEETFDATLPSNPFDAAKAGAKAEKRA